MKSLKESLFDKDLVNKKSPYEKLLTGRISKDDVMNFVEGWREGDFNIYNPAFRQWANDFYDRVVKPDGWDSFSYSTWNEAGEITKEALEQIKSGTIHNGASRRDCSQAVFLDISSTVWGDMKNITEWILFTTPTKYVKGFNTYLLINRNIYDDIDQAVMHKLITIASTIK